MVSLFRLATEDVDLVNEMRECIGRIKEFELVSTRDDPAFSWFHLSVPGAISESSGVSLALEDKPRDDEDVDTGDNTEATTTSSKSVPPADPLSDTSMAGPEATTTISKSLPPADPVPDTRMTGLEAQDENMGDNPEGSDTPRRESRVGNGDDQDQDMGDYTKGSDTPRWESRGGNGDDQDQEMGDNTKGNDTPRRENRGGNSGDQDENREDSTEGGDPPRENHSGKGDSQDENMGDIIEGDDTPHQESRVGKVGARSRGSDDEDVDIDDAPHTTELKNTGGKEDTVSLTVPLPRPDRNLLGSRWGKIRRPREPALSEEERQDTDDEDQPRDFDGSEKSQGKRKNPSPKYVPSRKKHKGVTGVQQTPGSSVDKPIDVDNPFVRLIAPPSSSCL
jgi:hypothetical protein